MLLNRPTGLAIMLLLLFLANGFGLVQTQTNARKLLQAYPKLNNKAIVFIKGIQWANIIAILFIWYGYQWAVWLALLLAVLVIGLDVYAGLYYHIWIVLISTCITGWFIYENWQLFR